MIVKCDCCDKEYIYSFKGISGKTLTFLVGLGWDIIIEDDDLSIELYCADCKLPYYDALTLLDNLVGMNMEMGL